MFSNYFLNFIKVIKYRDIVDYRDNCTVNIEILFSTLSHTPTSVSLGSSQFHITNTYN